ncbi:MAG: CDP-alcohol phosphatidyltransferase family protein [Deltaproteobacteria bacterium]|nr:CDP-alcohol phosphatidyltransferase family protein [Deltaproteobacteria bacterium]
MKGITPKNDDLHRSLKPLPVEEWLDYYFYRRVAHRLVPTLIKFKISPNQITTLSLLFGLLSAWLVYKHHFIAAGFVAIFAIILDCCDGQVARLTGQTSPFGRAMDGLFDAAWITAYWVALHKSHYFQSQGLFVFWLMFFSSISMVLHCWRFDARKLRYFELTGKEENEQDLDAMQAWALFKTSLKKFNLPAAFLALAMTFQMYFFVRGSEEKKTVILSDQEKKRAHALLDPIIHAWSYLGEGHHNTLVILGTFMAPWSPYGLLVAFLTILIPFNLWMFRTEWQWHKAVRLLKNEIDSIEKAYQASV